VLPTPPLAGIAIAYADAYERRYFHQRPLVSQTTFTSLARERGIALKSSAELEVLDKAGALRPIAFHLEPYFDPGLYMRLPLMAFTEDGYRPWGEYAWGRRGKTYITPLYSPWQLLYALDVVGARSLRVDLDTLSSADATQKMQAKWESFVTDRSREWMALDERWRPLIKLLVRLQNRYLPFVQGSSTMAYDPAVSDFIDPIEREVREFDARTVARELGLSRTQVEEVYVWLARRAQALDPAKHYYLLLRMAPHQQRERMRGDLRLAHDFYEAGAVVRQFYMGLTGRVLRDANEVDQPGLNRRVLGHTPRLHYTREDLKNVLAGLDVYPYGVHLFVEGETEEVLFEELFDLFLPDPEGVRVQNMHGVGGFAEKAQELFEHLTDYVRYTMLVADREGEMAKYARQWVKAGLVPRGHVVLWKSLEEANFSDAELVRMVERIGRRQDPDVRLRLTGKQLRRRYEDHKQRAPQPRGLAAYLLGIAGNPSIGPIRGSKSEDLGREMAELLKAEVDEKGWEAAANKRRVLRLVAGIGRVL
jgi:hypothetical protein